MELDREPPDNFDEEIRNCLQDATNANVQIVHRAEQKLTELEQVKHFFSYLARLAAGVAPQPHNSIDDNVRFMAAVYLKNGLNKYWRHGTRVELPTNEKAYIRDLLLNTVQSESVSQVALQLAVVIARIARYDCPREWPELMPDLMQRLQLVSEQSENTNQYEQRLLLVMHHVVKALASRRMMADKRIFEEICSNSFNFTQNLWMKYTALFFYQIEGHTSEAIMTLDCAILTFSVLRKFVVYGFAKPYRSEMCRQFVERVFQRLKQLVQLRYQLMKFNASQNLIAQLEKFILKKMKMVNEFQETHTSSFANFVPMALEFAFSHVFHDSAYLIFADNVINFSNFGIQCINLMKSIMSCDSYTPLDTSGEPESQPIILSEFFSRERLSYICEKIITYYFVLTQAELEQWVEDPECYGVEDFDDSWRYVLRSSIETFYLSCFTQYQEAMVSEVLKYVHKAQETQLTSESDLSVILQKDAVYNAAGLAAFQFYNEVDFDAWFRDQLVHELRIDTNNFRILRRRILALISQWTPVKFSRELRPLAYEACLHLLRPDEDFSIRLMAARTLSNLICDFDFEPEQFLRFLEPAFAALFVLLGQAKECDTKMNLLYIMSFVVEKMSDYIEPQAERLIAYLPMLWRESESYNMLRCAILGTLTQVVKAVRSIPDPLRPFLYSVIDLSLDLAQPYHVYLIEEGLALLLTVVENSTQMSSELLDLSRHLLPIVEMSSENLRVVIIIIQAYILLDDRGFLDRHGKHFVEFCVSTFDDIRAEGIVLMLKVFELAMKVDGTNGLELIRPALPHIFKSIYLNKEYPMLMGMYLVIVARVLLISHDVFTSVVQQMMVPDGVEVILNVWLEKFPLVPEYDKRKLFCLALCSILSSNQLVLERFPAIMQQLANTLIDIMRNEDEDRTDAGDQPTHPPKYYDSLVYTDENEIDSPAYCTIDDFDYKTYHYDRYRQLTMIDPVHTVNLPEYLEYQLNALRTQLSADKYIELMQTVCPSVIDKLRMFVDLKPPQPQPQQLSA